jgi:hypothetical protein
VQTEQNGLSSVQNILRCNLLRPFARASRKISFRTSLYIDSTETSSYHLQARIVNNTLASHLLLMVSILRMKKVPILGQACWFNYHKVYHDFPYHQGQQVRGTQVTPCKPFHGS